MGSSAPTSARVHIRAWPRLDSTAHLVLLDVSMIPTTDDVDRWVDDVFTGSPDVDAIRTGALFPRAAAAFTDRAFTVVDRLALLERRIERTGPLPPRRRRADIALRSLRRRDLESAASIDGAAFPAGWQNSADTLADICDATPSVRARRALTRRADDRRADVGFAITGFATDTGYLQRLAVSPDARRRGVAGHLVDDAIRWLARRGADRALVNTGVDNDAALALYEGRGFARRDDELVVLERRR